MRVRVGLHSGTVTTTGVHEKTKRTTYGGRVMRVAEAVANAPCGGQIVMSGDTLASITSLQDLMLEASHYCADWASCAPNSSKTAVSAGDEMAALSVASLGFHVLDGLHMFSDTASVDDEIEGQNPASSSEHIMQWLSSVDNAPSETDSPEKPFAVPEMSDAQVVSELRWISENLAANQSNETCILDQSREIIEVVPWPLRERVR
jgi:hypothetical protein